MGELSSTEFRKRFARLSEPVVVTVNGHPIGTWTPGVPRIERLSVEHDHDRAVVMLRPFGTPRPAPKR